MGAFTEYDANWLDEDQATRLFRDLVEQLDWSERPIYALGKELMQPRLIAWAGELPYKYSGQTLEAQPTAPVLKDVLQAVSTRLGVPFNHVLLNRYRDGRDNMGMHADNEPELGKNATIAAISLGVDRWFVMCPKGKKANRFKRKFKLTHGSLFVMRGTVQHRWRHGVPKMGEVEQERINLTFRLLKGPPGWRGQD